MKMLIESYFNLYNVGIKWSHAKDPLDRIVQRKIGPPESECV